jgi:glycosyltransferase involved in cell wall biosynthesis
VTASACGVIDESPDLSICIPTWNRAKLLGPLLEHLLFVESLPFTVEIVVYDNASSDDTADVVRSYQDRLPIRFYTQPVNLGVVRNTSAAFRSAKGSYTLYLADDDRLIPEALVRHMALLMGRPELVVLHAPWLLWDAEKDVPISLFYAIEHMSTFDAKGAVNCLDFLLSRNVLPEIAIYRTDVLHQILHYPHSVYVGFVMLFRAFSYGSVCFAPEPFYKFLSRAGGGVEEGPLGQAGHSQAMSYLDEYRGSIEVALISALRGVAPLPVPADLNKVALQMINRFLVGRLEVAARLSLARGDFIAAFEFKQREWLWRDDLRNAEVVEWEQKYLTFVALQSVAEVHRAHSHFETLVLCGFAEADADTCCWILDQLSPPTEVVVLSVDEALALNDLSEHLYLVASESDEKRLLNADLAVGQVVQFGEVQSLYRTLPRSFSA